MESVVCNLLLKCGDTGIAFDHLQLKKTLCQQAESSVKPMRERKEKGILKKSSRKLARWTEPGQPPTGHRNVWKI